VTELKSLFVTTATGKDPLQPQWVFYNYNYFIKTAKKIPLRDCEGEKLEFQYQEN